MGRGRPPAAPTPAGGCRGGRGGRRERVDEPQVGAVGRERAGLLGERQQLDGRVHVARRHDLDGGDQFVAADVPDRHRLGLRHVGAHVGLPPDPGAGGGGRQQVAVGVFRLIHPVAGRGLEGENVRPELAGDLPGEGVVVGRPPAGVECPADATDPLVAEVVEDARLDPGPVVDRLGPS